MILAPNGFVPGSFPNEIGYGYGPDGNYLGPIDPQHNQAGEYGMYPDTMLGKIKRKPGLLGWLGSLGKCKPPCARGSAGGRAASLAGIPTDAELAVTYGYTPVNSGWIASNQGYVTGPWVPPNGWRPAGAFGPPTSLNGLHDAEIVQATPNDLIAALNEHNQKMFTLALVSTIVAGLAATLTVYRTAKLLREE